MKRLRSSSVRLACFAFASLVAVSTPATTNCQIRFVRHWDLQAVTETGTSAWAGSYPFTIIGVLLTDPDEMLDSTPNFQPASSNNMGGQWQMVIQALPPDRGGTFLWMGQNYAIRRPPYDDAFSYTDEEWVAEINRLNRDPYTGHAFRKGDLVAVTANASLFYGGKRNVNEAHRKEPEYDFYIVLLAPNYGLPEPEVITLASLVRPDDGNPSTSEDIFDPTRMSGGEYWQGMRVRINGLKLVTTNGWNPTLPWSQRICIVTDGENRFFKVRPPRYSLGPAPTNWFDAIGILNQESESGVQGTNGYELFIQEVLPAEEPRLKVEQAVVVSWPSSLSNYRLLSAESPVSTNWVPVTNKPVLIGDTLNVLCTLTNTQRFFRLERIR